MAFPDSSLILGKFPTTILVATPTFISVSSAEIYRIGGYSLACG